MAEAMQKCDSLGSGVQLILHGNVSEPATYVLPSVRTPRQAYLENLVFSMGMLLIGTLGKSLNVQDIDVEDNAWVIMWKQVSATMQYQLA